MTNRTSAWSLYPATILSVPLDKNIRIDLRRSLGATVRKRLAYIGLARPFAVITACNPLDRAIPTLEAARLNHELRAMLALHGSVVVPMDGMSPDGRHVEPGFAAMLPRETARRIARFFEQTAFFWFDGRHFWIEPACGDHARVRLPVGR